MAIFIGHWGHNNFIGSVKMQHRRSERVILMQK